MTRTCPFCRGNRLVIDIPAAQIAHNALLPAGVAPDAHVMRCAPCGAQGWQEMNAKSEWVKPGAGVFAMVHSGAVV